MTCKSGRGLKKRSASAKIVGWTKAAGGKNGRSKQMSALQKSTDGLTRGWHQPKSSDSRCGIRQNRRVGKKVTTEQNFYLNYPFKNTKIPNELNRPLNPTKAQAPSQHYAKQTAGAQKAVIKRPSKFVPGLFKKSGH